MVGPFPRTEFLRSVVFPHGGVGQCGCKAPQPRRGLTLSNLTVVFGIGAEVVDVKAAEVAWVVEVAEEISVGIDLVRMGKVQFVQDIV